MAEQRVIDAVIDGYTFATADATIDDVRSGYDESMGRGVLPAGVTREEAEVAEVPGAWFRPEDPSGRVVLFVHGGGYLFGSSRSHGPLAALIASESRAAVFVADYRLAPENPYPAAVEDTSAMLSALIEEHGASNVVIAGDSAGGGLALATLLAAKGAGAPLPLAAATMSAWADLSQASPSVVERAGVDPLMTKDQLDGNAAGYLGDGDRTDPLVSPVFGDLSGLPALYMQVGTEEILHDDTHRVADAVRAAGGTVTVDVEQGMPHVHQILLWNLPEAPEAVARFGAFIRNV